MSDAHEISRAYIASQYSHRSGPAFEMARPRRISWWAVVRNAAALGFCLLVVAIFWIGSGR